MAKKIQDGEQQANDKFSGFVFQGNSYEGLTCDALEWYQSAGAGGFIDNGKVTINNPKGARILDQFRAQIGKITPRDVTTYQEGEAHTAFVEGNAAFMRNWPYAYSIGADPKSSKIVGKFSVTVLPRGPGDVGRHGRRMAARREQVLEARRRVDRVRPLHDERGGAEVLRHHQHERADHSGGREGPGRREGEPVPEARDRQRQRVTRPSRDLEAHYNEGSKAIYQGINQILNGRPASSVLPSIESKLNRILR